MYPVTTTKMPRFNHYHKKLSPLPLYLASFIAILLTTSQCLLSLDIINIIACFYTAYMSEINRYFTFTSLIASLSITYFKSIHFSANSKTIIFPELNNISSWIYTTICLFFIFCCHLYIHIFLLSSYFEFK